MKMLRFKQIQTPSKAHGYFVTNEGSTFAVLFESEKAVYTYGTVGTNHNNRCRKIIEKKFKDARFVPLNEPEYQVYPKLITLFESGTLNGATADALEITVEMLPEEEPTFEVETLL
jgi:hypothetical protein